MRKRVLRSENVERAPNGVEEESNPLQEIMNACVQGPVWARLGLEFKNRSMPTGSAHSFESLSGNQNMPAPYLHNGAKPEELVEVLLHTIIYCCFPAAADGFRALQDVMKERT